MITKKYGKTKPFLSYILLGVFCLISQFSWSQNDTLILKNNDKIIGEIKSMDRGVVTVKTSYSDSNFKITWIDIKSIRSKQTFLLNLTNGKRINSTLNTNFGEDGQVTFIENDTEITVPIKNIVFIKPIKNDFMSRINASISLGFNITKSNNLKQFSVNSNLSYTAYKWLLNGSYNSVRSNQNDVDETQRTDASLAFNYFMKNDWFYSSEANFLSNDEQKLKLRSTVKTGFGKYFIHTNKLYFGGGVGVAYNSEQFSDDLNTQRNSMEAYANLSLNMFDFNDFSMNTGLTFYPSLTESSRYRADYKLNLKYDLPLDFFIKLGLTYNYDSKPVEGASVSDYVFQSTFGWEFN
ncbi:DUF481 domain-containing protein [Bizionia argentinensis JUB59]|uniref:DUF481 domain-containing protein n=1 Tax=Bizionia argentinensis JUB59 TaxID=1046627 RepID=G2EE87_9FLAO|nr:DUF481 domain-containing protein [Bizionia argentinensis]EGV43242.1 DUF481 domain-containing protein [Bizionia argentinensis JUB59]